MQFHEKKLDLFDFTSFFAWIFLNFLSCCVLWPKIISFNCSKVRTYSTIDLETRQGYLVLTDQPDSTFELGIIKFVSKRPVKIRRQQRRIQALFKFFNFPPSRSRCQAALRKCRKIAPRLWSSIWSHAEATINAFPQLILGLFWVYYMFLSLKKNREKK